MRSASRPTLSRAAVLLVMLAAAATEARAIEMFTYFGDGSRIGLPSLEVPIEAYPGIPLRSDRLRARRRAMRAGPGTAVRVGPGTPVGGMTIRAMPTGPVPVPAAEPVPAPRPQAPPRTAPGRPAAR